MSDEADPLYWRNLHARPIATEDIVGGLHRIELIEEFSPYRPTPYFTRAETSMRQLPIRFWDAAMAIFSNVTYLHADLLNSIYRYHWHAVREIAELSGNTRPESFNDIVLLEVDPAGMSAKFAQENQLAGRLNPDRKIRIDHVQDALRMLEDATARDDSERRRESRRDLFAMSGRQHWIVLTDKALSVQSLRGDIEKFIGLRRILTRWNPDSNPFIYVCAQVMTSDAYSWLHPSDVTLIPEWTDISLIPAIKIDRRMKVNDSECALFNNKSIQNDVEDLCVWFDQSILAHDKRFDDVRRNSRGNMAFGYRSSGILIADAHNTPTNSLPVLWYSSAEEDHAVSHMPSECPTYTGPFPRTHSRIGPERPRSATDRWKPFLEEDIDVHLALGATEESC